MQNEERSDENKDSFDLSAISIFLFSICFLLGIFILSRNKVENTDLVHSMKPCQFKDLSPAAFPNERRVARILNDHEYYNNVIEFKELAWTIHDYLTADVFGQKLKDCEKLDIVKVFNEPRFNSLHSPNNIVASFDDLVNQIGFLKDSNQHHFRLENEMCLKTLKEFYFVVFSTLNKF